LEREQLAYLAIMNKPQAGELVYLDPSLVIVDYTHNSRIDQSPGTTPNELEPHKELAFSQLILSIKQRGFLEFPGVRLRQDGTYILRYGFRRFHAWQEANPGEPIPCVCIKSEGLEIEETLSDRIDNLTENWHRKSVRAYEVAEVFYQIKHVHGTTQREIAETFGVDESYVCNLVKVRSKSHPEVWRLFSKLGPSLSIRYTDLLKIVDLPTERQIDAYNALVEEKKQRGAGNGKRGKDRRPSREKILKWISRIQMMDQKSRQWRLGALHMARAALGEIQFEGVEPPKEEKETDGKAAATEV
jgi:ParB-like chromosome segregation protein Spo0J